MVLKIISFLLLLFMKPSAVSPAREKGEIRQYNSVLNQTDCYLLQQLDKNETVQLN